MNHYTSEMCSGSSGCNEELDSKPAASTTPGTERPSSSITLVPPRRTKGSDRHQHEDKEPPTAPPTQAARGLESLPSSPRRETASTKLIHNGESLSPRAAADAKIQKNPDKEFTALNRSNARDSVFNPDRVIFPNPLSPRQSYPYDSLLPLSTTRNQEPSIAAAMNLIGILPTEQGSSLATNVSAQELLMLQDQLDRNRQLAQWLLQLRCNAAAATDMLVGSTAGVLPYSFPTTSPYSQLPQTTLPTDDLLRLLLQPRLQPSLRQVDFLSRSAGLQNALEELVKQARPPQWQEQQLLQLQLQREQLQPQLQVREQLLQQLREQQQRQLPQLQLQQQLQLPQLQQDQLKKRLRHLFNDGQDNDQPSPSQKKKQRSDQRKDRDEPEAAEKIPAMEECSNEAKTGEIELPPCIDSDVIPPMASRRIFPLGIEEDANWLSEFHCFLREEIIEVFQASHHDVKARNNSIVLKQIGLRCRCCAHRTGVSCRPGRSSAFPSSIDQIYQSFTMMLRDHFSNCDAIHKREMGERYTLLKDRSSQGAIDSKRYWACAGLKIGMIDAKSGIFMNKESRLEGLTSLPFGVEPKTRWREGDYADVSLVVPSDRENIPEFLYLLLSQAQPIRLTKGECIGSRRNLRVGLAGFGCRHCCRQQRMGLCRVFPARRKTLPTKTFALYDHIRRCPLCPASLKAALVAGKQQYDDKVRTDQDGHRRYYDSLWERIGNCSSSKKLI